MKIELKADIKQLTKKLNKVQRQQIPFAASNTLNDLAFMARTELRKQAKKKFDNPIDFTLNGFQVVKAKKTNLISVVFIESKRYEYMKLEVEGGVRMPKQRALVIPTSKMPLNKYGNMKRKQIKTLLGKRNVFSGKVNGKPGIWQNNDNRTVTRLASYKPSAPYKPLFHFEKIVKGIVNSKFRNTFEKNLKHAIKTKR